VIDLVMMSVHVGSRPLLISTAPKTSPPGFRVELAAGLAADGAEEEDEELGLTMSLGADEEVEEEVEDEE
jgi:hypothetical protein